MKHTTYSRKALKKNVPETVISICLTIFFIKKLKREESQLCWTGITMKSTNIHQELIEKYIKRGRKKGSITFVQNVINAKLQTSWKERVQLLLSTKMLLSPLQQIVELKKDYLVPCSMCWTDCWCIQLQEPCASLDNSKLQRKVVY